MGEIKRTKSRLVLRQIRLHCLELRFLHPLTGEAETPACILMK